jgi:NADH-quinone oxidoreductase subunit E
LIAEEASVLTEKEIKELDRELGNFTKKTDGVLEALKVVQNSRGWVSDDAVGDVAAYTGATPEEVEAIATFYPMVYRKPVGRHIIHVCDGIVCWIMGYEGVYSRLQEMLGIKPGETTSDGRFTLLPVSCIGSCDRAPALMIDGELHRDVTVDSISGILGSYE